MYEESSYLSASIVKNFHIFTEKDKYEPLNSYFTAAKVTNIFLIIYQIQLNKATPYENLPLSGTKSTILSPFFSGFVLISSSSAAKGDTEPTFPTQVRFVNHLSVGS